MRIAYLLDEALHASAGVSLKIAKQAEVWRREGNEVFIYGMRDQAALAAQVAAKPLTRKFLQHAENCAAALAEVRAIAPDVIYSRYIKYAPGFAAALRNVAPYIVEVNTNDVVEFGVKNRWHGLYNKCTRNAFFRAAAGLVAVTNELSEGRDFAKFGLPSVVIGNGFDFESACPVLRERVAPFRPSLLFVGSAAMPWHGVDKALRLSSLLSEFEFHLVGPSKSDFPSSQREMANVIWHGQQSEEYIKRLIARCDVGISSLALHRNGMAEACPLKSRQYLAYGLPVLLAYKDPDLQALSKDFALVISNTERNVEDHADAIRNFVLNAVDCDRSRLHSEARRLVDLQVKEHQRLEFLKTIAVTPRPPVGAGDKG